jgi:hypothetical protein
MKFNIPKIIGFMVLSVPASFLLLTFVDMGVSKYNNARLIESVNQSVSKINQEDVRKNPH